MTETNTSVTTEYLRNNLYKKPITYYQNLRVPEKPWAYDLDFSFFNKGDALNEQAINMSILNIILSLNGEYLFEPTVGSKLGFALFENMTEERGEAVLDSIIDSVERIDTRVSFIKNNCKMVVDTSNNSVSLDLPYIVKNLRRSGKFNKTISL